MSHARLRFTLRRCTAAVVFVLGLLLESTASIAESTAYDALGQIAANAGLLVAFVALAYLGWTVFVGPPIENERSEGEAGATAE